MEKSEIYTKILLNLQKKFNQVNEVMNMTKEIETALNLNDHESLRLVLMMRSKAMAQVDEIDAYNLAAIDELPTVSDKKRVHDLLLPHTKATKFEDPMEQRIYESNQRILSLLQKVMVIDSVLNKKMNHAVKSGRAQASRV